MMQFADQQKCRSLFMRRTVVLLSVGKGWILLFISAAVLRFVIMWDMNVSSRKGTLLAWSSGWVGLQTHEAWYDRLREACLHVSVVCYLCLQHWLGAENEVCEYKDLWCVRAQKRHLYVVVVWASMKPEGWLLATFVLSDGINTPTLKLWLPHWENTAGVTERDGP